MDSEVVGSAEISALIVHSCSHASAARPRWVLQIWWLSPFTSHLSPLALPTLLEPLELVTEREQVVKDGFSEIEHVLRIITRNCHVYIGQEI